MTTGRSSEIQVLPAIRPQVKKLFHFVRQPTWIAPPVGEEYRKYSDEDIQVFVSDSGHHLNMRRQIESRMNSTFETFRRGSLMQEKTREYMQSSMMKKLNNHELSKQFALDVAGPRQELGTWSRFYIKKLRPSSAISIAFRRRVSSLKSAPHTPSTFSSAQLVSTRHTSLTSPS